MVTKFWIEREGVVEGERGGIMSHSSRANWDMVGWGGGEGG